MLKMKAVRLNTRDWQGYALMLKMCIAITTLASPIFNPYVIDPRSSVGSVQDHDQNQRIQHEL